MPRRKTRPVRKSDYSAFMGKAEQFLQTMEGALVSSQWDSAGLQAVHAIISASDALVAYYGGLRSAEPDHREVVGLLQETLGSASRTACHHVTRVIAKKNMVEYEQRRLSQKEASDMAEDARRFLGWAKEMLPPA